MKYRLPSFHPLHNMHAPRLFTNPLASLLRPSLLLTLSLFTATAAPSLPNFAPGPPIDRPTGFFHAKQLHGRWWLIDPNGCAFYMIGTDHIGFDGMSCEVLGYAPYGRNARAKYGTEEKWIETQRQRLLAWGFNTLPYSTEGLHHKELAHIETLSLGTTFSSVDSISPKTTWTGLPNVFNPEWPKHCDRIAREHCTKVKDDPWVLGYFLDNELEWFGTIEPMGLFGEAWRKPVTNYVKTAWIDFLRRQLRNPAEFQKHWGVAITNFSDLENHLHPQPARTPRGEAIALGFVREIAERYFRTCAEAIRRYDTNHMILGCRFASRAPAIWDIAGKYCDAVTFNYYKWIDVKRGVPEELVQEITGWYRQAQKPMIVTEWSFPALDAGLPCIWGGGMRVDTQAQRTQCFNHFQKTMFALPFMVGSSWFMYIDEPAQGISKSFPEDSNYGLIDVNDQPYPELTKAVAALNPQVYQIHREGKLPPLARKGHLARWLSSSSRTSAGAPPEHIRLTSGPLTVEGPVDGHALRLRRGDLVLGELFAYLQQETEGWLWVATDTARIIAVREDRHATFVDMEMSSEGRTPPITRLSAPSPKDLRPARYRGVWRFGIPKGNEGWLSTQCLWLENTDPRTWTVVQSYYFLLPAIGGSIDGDVPLYAPDLHCYYLTGAAWVDMAAHAGVGCWFLPEPSLECTFWVDKLGRYRSDMRYLLNERLRPGQRWNKPGPITFFFPLADATREAYESAQEKLHESVVVGSRK